MNWGVGTIIIFVLCLLAICLVMLYCQPPSSDYYSDEEDGQ